MKSFETYVLQQEIKNKIKNFQAGDEVKYIGNHPPTFMGIPIIKFNEVCTFLGLKEVAGKLYAKIERKNYNLLINPKDIIKA